MNGDSKKYSHASGTFLVEKDTLSLFCPGMSLLILLWVNQSIGLGKS